MEWGFVPSFFGSWEGLKLVLSLLSYNFPLNKRPMGHIAHLRNQFKSINTLHQTNGYIITLIRSGKKNVISFLRIECSIFVNPWVPFTHFLPSLVEIGLVVLKKKTLNFISVFSLFLYDLPLGKGSAPSFEQFWIPFTLYPGMLCAKFGWNCHSGSGEEDENVKSLRHRRRLNDNDDRQRTNFDQKSSL